MDLTVDSEDKNRCLYHHDESANQPWQKGPQQEAGQTASKAAAAKAVGPATTTAAPTAGPVTPEVSPAALSAQAAGQVQKRPWLYLLETRQVQFYTFRSQAKTRCGLKEVSWKCGLEAVSWGRGLKAG